MNNGGGQKYCLDTNIFIEGWETHYPERNFPSLWKEMENIIINGVAVVPNNVLEEIRKKTPLHQWIHSLKPYIFDTDKDIHLKVAEIVNTYPDITQGRTSSADPFVVAVAMKFNIPVVTYERPRKKKLKINKIPNLCNKLGVKWITFSDMIRELKWVF